MTVAPRALVPMAQDTEDMELVVLTDVLSRGGIQVLRAAATMDPVRLQHGTRILPDLTLAEARDQRFDLVALPGGWEGAQRLDADPDLAAILATCRVENRLVAAVCSAPTVLRRHGLIAGNEPFTTHPGSVSFAEGGHAHLYEATVSTPTVITGRSAGHTLDWALALVERLRGAEVRQQVRESLAML